MAKTQKRVYPADTRVRLQVHLVEKPSAAAVAPQDAMSDRPNNAERQAVVNRLIDFFKGL